MAEEAEVVVGAVVAGVVALTDLIALGASQPRRLREGPNEPVARVTAPTKTKSPSFWTRLDCQEMRP